MNRTAGIFLTTGPTAPVSAANGTSPTLALASPAIADSTSDDFAADGMRGLTVYASLSQVGSVCAACGITVINSVAPPVPQTGMWWNPSEPGTGCSPDVRHNVLVLGVYSYTSLGASQWYLSSGAMSTDGTTFTGKLDKYVNGECVTCSYSPAYMVGNDGTFTLRFSSATKATLTLPTRTVESQPQPF